MKKTTAKLAALIIILSKGLLSCKKEDKGEDLCDLSVELESYQQKITAFSNNPNVLIIN